MACRNSKVIFHYFYIEEGFNQIGVIDRAVVIRGSLLRVLCFSLEEPIEVKRVLEQWGFNLSDVLDCDVGMALWEGGI